MRDKVENLKLFIAEHKAYFLARIASDVSFDWEDDSWCTNNTHKGVFSGGGSGGLEFKNINSIRKGIYLDGENEIDVNHEVNREYRDFMKAFIVFIIKLRNHNISITALHRDNLLLKRVYIRMFINGESKPTANSISDKVISQAMLAHCAAMSNMNNKADSHTAMSKICKYITQLAITFNPVTFSVTQKRPSSKSTAAAKSAKTKAFHDAKYAEETDEDESKKLITIQTFLNIIAARSMVTSDGEKILLNMLMLLMVTGFRFGELERVLVSSLKKLEVADDEAAKILRKKGLKDYYLGIVYVGEKKSGHRTHWVEPFAIDLVESIFNDTIRLTEPVREHIIQCRYNGFSSLLPVELKGKSEISLHEIVTYISESLSTTALARGASSQRDYAKKSLSKLGIEPSRVETINGRQKDFYYTPESIDSFLKKKISSTQALNPEFIYSFVDSLTGNHVTHNFEDLLFIASEGSFSLARSSVIKPLPVPISMEDMLKFVGANSGKGGLSLFKKYNLIDEYGNFPALTTHMPRHTINTFLAIAGVADHIQAVMMGRVDISQNSAYHHLAIEQRALASEVVSTGTQLDLFHNENKALLSPLDIIKDRAEISINPNLSLENAIAQNIHTFTTKEDTSSFIRNVFEASSLDLMAGLGDAFAIEKSDSARDELLNRHADLHPLDFGSCMRKLQAWSCPYSMKCQDGSLCPYFTMIGRADDMSKLVQKELILRKQIKGIRQLLLTESLSQIEYDEIVSDFDSRVSNLLRIRENLNEIESTKVNFNLVELDEHKKPKTLATLFAIEHMKVEGANNA
ncbi:MAG: hypothetical protein ACRCTP_19585 [Aeromonas popoffii]|uniref:hypothetical protein n=1 Tax=Aeromonas popoffii TaxID=70856 RepID=UPI003F412A55